MPNTRSSGCGSQPDRQGMIDDRLGEYSSNPIVGPLAEQMKEKYRESILEKAAEARLKSDGDD